MMEVMMMEMMGVMMERVEWMRRQMIYMTLILKRKMNLIMTIHPTATPT
jgi:hypothetical protein